MHLFLAYTCILYVLYVKKNQVLIICMLKLWFISASVITLLVCMLVINTVSHKNVPVDFEL